MNYTEFIVEIKNIVDPSFIKKIIPLIKHKSKNNLSIRTGVDKNIRKC